MDFWLNIEYNAVDHLAGISVAYGRSEVMLRFVCRKPIKRTEEEGNWPVSQMLLVFLISWQDCVTSYKAVNIVSTTSRPQYMSTEGSSRAQSQISATQFLQLSKGGRGRLMQTIQMHYPNAPAARITGQCPKRQSIDFCVARLTKSPLQKGLPPAKTPVHSLLQGTSSEVGNQWQKGER